MRRIYFPSLPLAPNGMISRRYSRWQTTVRRIRITVDGNDKGVREQVDRWCHCQRLSSLLVADGLADKEHAVTIELLSEPPDRSAPIEEAKRVLEFVIARSSKREG